jgi:hypothetical protein
MTTKLPTALLEPCWGNRRIDRRAWSVIERCRKRQASERPPLPIPVEDWIEGPLGIQLGFADLSYQRAIGFEPTTSSLGIRCSARK